MEALLMGMPKETYISSISEVVSRTIRHGHESN